MNSTALQVLVLELLKAKHETPTKTIAPVAWKAVEAQPYPFVDLAVALDIAVALLERQLDTSGLIDEYLAEADISVRFHQIAAAYEPPIPTDSDHRR